MIIADLILMIYFFVWYLSVLTAILFSISGADDLFFDIAYWVRFYWRKWKMRRYEPLSYEQLAGVNEQHIAIMVPCWHEDNIIATMLTHNCLAIDYKNYDIFVGVYPNDPSTVEAVKRVSDTLPQVHAIIGSTPGPTNKASNLNQVYTHIKKYETDNNLHYAAFVFHDSEDIIHPLSFKLYNYLIPRKDMIQIPIFPLAVNYLNFTHWLYCDEFCENHTKDIIVREAIHGLVPSAGVGTAFSRKALRLLSKDNHGVPFETYSLTEDYKTALTIRLKGLKQIFVLHSILRTEWRKRWFFWGRYRKKKVHEYIATRALFPMEYVKAVRQRARWITGIAIQETWNTGLVGSPPTKYTLLHDRKALFTHIVNTISYILLLFWLIYGLITYNLPQFPSLQEQFNLHPWVWYLVVFVTILMVERVIQRTIAIVRVFNRWAPTLLIFPRMLYGNIINFHALVRAYRQFFFSPKKERSKPKWDKTEHHFPGSHILVPYKQRIGELLVQHNMISQEQLDKIVIEQEEKGERIGDILKRYNYITPAQLKKIIAYQYKLPLVKKSEFKQLRRKETPGLSFYNYYWLIHHKAYPYNFDPITKNIGIAILDPSNQQLIKKIIAHTKPYQVTFTLLDRE